MCGSECDEKWFDNGISWNIGSGVNINFLIDEWVDGQSLASMFPRLSSLGTKGKGYKWYG